MAERRALDLDALAISDRFQLFNFTRRDDHITYLWILRAMDRLREVHQVQVVALDEAFAGIDDRYKPELMGLTVTFDLDMFMTGHDLWVHYDSVPMAAHYDMHHDKGSHTVSAMLMLWDGAQTVDADAGFSGNDELAAELLGLTPSRFVPQSTAGTLLAVDDTHVQDCVAT